MQVDKEEEKAIRQALQEWLAAGIMSPEQVHAAEKTIAPKSSERQQLAQYFFIIAISSALLAFGALFIDEKLLEHFRRTFLLSNYTIALAATVLAALSFWHASHRRRKLSTIGFEVYQIPGGLSVLVALVYLCKEIGNGASYTFFTGLCTVVFFILSLVMRSRLLWLGVIASLMGWFGAFSTVHSGNNLFLGMNYPVRFTIFGLLVIALAALQKRVPRLEPMRTLTYHAGLIIFFTGLWGISVFGNYSTLDAWQAVRQARILPYAVVTGIITAVALYMGIHRRDEPLRDYSILFLLLNLYTRYFEYFWDSLNKGLFFLVLAISFGLLARWLSNTNKDIFPLQP